MNQPKHKAVVVGGGIAGLSAALTLQEHGVEVEIHEATDRWGGKIYSSPVGDRMVDAGPDTFLARAPQGVALCRRLGLEDQLVSPIAPVPAYIHHNGLLASLPTGTVLGIPTDFDAIKQSGLVSAEGIQRAQQDLTMPRTEIADDCTLGWLCRTRLGDEVTDRLIDPLLGGINASNIDDLSLAAAFPALARVARTNDSLILGLRDHRSAIGPTLGSAHPSEKPAPVFYSLPGGMATLVEKMVAKLTSPDRNQRPASLHLDSAVSSLALGPDKPPVVLATPAAVSARLLRSSHPEAAALLEMIRYTAVSQVTYEFHQSHINPILDASGILFPRVDGLVATAATWLSTKWKHYQSDQTVLIRVTSGRADDLRSAQMTDTELVDALFRDLSTVIAITDTPRSVRVQRWPGAFPQYTPGHVQRVDRIRTLLRSPNGPMVTVAGAGFDGIGIPACIGSGQRAAAELVVTPQSSTEDA